MQVTMIAATTGNKPELIKQSDNSCVYIGEAEDASALSGLLTAFAPRIAQAFGVYLTAEDTNGDANRFEVFGKTGELIGWEIEVELG